MRSTVTVYALTAIAAWGGFSSNAYADTYSPDSVANTETFDDTLSPDPHIDESAPTPVYLDEALEWTEETSAVDLRPTPSIAETNVAPPSPTPAEKLKPAVEDEPMADLSSDRQHSEPSSADSTPEATSADAAEIQPNSAIAEQPEEDAAPINQETGSNNLDSGLGSEEVTQDVTPETEPDSLPESHNDSPSGELSDSESQLSEQTATDSENVTEAIAEEATDEATIARQREWLNNQLAAIAKLEAPERLAELQENLIHSAQRYAERGEFDQARQTAQNPALPPVIQSKLLSRIDRLAQGVTDATDDQVITLDDITSEAPQVNVDYSYPNVEAVTQWPRSMPTDFTLRPLLTDVARRCPVDTPSLSTSQTLLDLGQQMMSTMLQSFGFKAEKPATAQMGLLANQSSQPMDVVTVARDPSFTGFWRSLFGHSNDCSTPEFNLQIASQTQFPIDATSLRSPSMVFPLPFVAAITSDFGWRWHPISGDLRFHEGIDYGAPTGTPVLSTMPGQVTSTGWMGGYGLTVIVDHGQTETLYGHLSAIGVEPGSWVESGTMLGAVGSTGNSTGPHLHFELRQDTPNGAIAVDPYDDLKIASLLVNPRPAIANLPIAEPVATLPPLPTPITASTETE